MDLLNPYLTQEEIAERNGYDSDKKIQRFKGCMVDKIANVAKMSTEELQAVDLDFKNYYSKFQKLEKRITNNFFDRCR